MTNVPVTDASGNPSEGMDDVLFPGVTQGTLFATDTKTDKVYEVRLTGLDPNAPIIAFNGGSIGGFNEVAVVNPLTGVVETPILTGLSSPHGLDFIPFAVPEPSTWALMLLGFAGLGFSRDIAATRRRRSRPERKVVAIGVGALIAEGATCRIASVDARVVAA